VRQQPEHRALGLASQPGHQVGSHRVHAEQRDLQAGPLEPVGEVLLSRALVAGRVDRVDPQQLPQHGHSLVLQIDAGHSGLLYSVIAHERLTMTP
jgi:hypothetical protein